MKLQDWMMSPSPVGGKNVMFPPPMFELKGQPKLVFMHTCTVCVRCTANEYKQTMLYEDHGPQTASYSYVHTDKGITIICITV